MQGLICLKYDKHINIYCIAYIGLIVHTQQEDTMQCQESINETVTDAPVRVLCYD
jgi:hypothetical protein